jgi:dolichyl-diphosphooligosaccharide--protein glycosyltransferase
MRHPPERWKTGVVLAAIFYAFLYLCFFNYGGVVFERELRLFGADPYYHVRRVWLTALDYPRLLQFDSYLNFPVGSYIQWPPGFDYLLASICRAVLGPDPTLYEAGRVCVLVSPFLGVPAVALVAAMGFRWFGGHAGLLAAFFTAMNFNMVHVSRVGRVDHHMLEPFFLMLVLYLFQRAYDSGGALKRLPAGLALAVSFLFVPIAIVFPPILLGFLFLKGAVDVLRGRYDGRLLGAGVWTFFWSFLFTLPLSMTSHFARAGQFEAGSLSLFQPAMLLCALLLAVGFRAAASLERKVSLRFLPLFLLATAALATPLLFLPPIKGVWMFLLKSDPIASSITESQSVLDYGVVNYVKRSPLLIALPALFLWALYTAKRERGIVAPLCAYWLAATAVLGAVQIRLAPLLVPAFSLALAGLLQKGIERASENGVLRRAGAAPVLLLLVLMGSTYPALESYARSESEYLTPTMRSLGMVFDSLLWLRDQTPVTSHLAAPHKKPEYGVMASWDFGHYLNFYAGRPNISNPFSQLKTNREGILNAARFFAEPDGERAAELCRRLGARYILTEEQDIRMHLHYLGLKEEAPPGLDDEQAAGRYLSATGRRLYYLDGSAVNRQGVTVEALGHFRLVYESRHDSGLKEESGAGLSAFKVFEFVEGVRVHGRTAPATEVSAVVPVLTNRGRSFQYLTRTRSDAEGRYGFTLPYSITGGTYGTGAAGPYEITSGGKVVRFSLTEEEIMAGATREINLI